MSIIKVQLTAPPLKSSSPPSSQAFAVFLLQSYQQASDYQVP